MAQIDRLALILDAAAGVTRGLDKALEGVGLSTAQYRVLAALAAAERNGEPLTPSQLAALLLQEPHSISGLLNRLEDKGIIIRASDRADRRVRWITLSDEGKRLARVGAEVYDSVCIDFDTALEAAYDAGGERVDMRVGMIGDDHALGKHLAPAGVAISRIDATKRAAALYRVAGR